jgi:hypothetical protein
MSYMRSILLSAAFGPGLLGSIHHVGVDGDRGDGGA